MPKILLELSCGSASDSVVAERAGADRVELCSALFLGGLTPSAAAIQRTAAHLQIPFVVLIRPRSGGFCYSPDEMEVMESDAEFALANGAKGIVFGILHSDGTVDIKRCERIREKAAAKDAVFHRAFDVVPDPLRALDEIIDMGFTRVLTSGQSNSALEGGTMIRRFMDYAKGRIEIIPGSRIRPANVLELISLTRCTQVHMTASRTFEDLSTHAQPSVSFGGPGAPPEHIYHGTDENVVRETVRILKTLEKES